MDDYTNIDYWKEHFHSSAKLSMHYYTVSDGTKLLGVHSTPSQATGNQPVILIPGWFSMLFGWTDVTKYLSEHTEIFYFETREKLSSLLPSHDVKMGVPRMAKDLAEISRDMPFPIEQAIVVASSMGGTLMFDYLAKEESYPSRTVLIGPNAEFKVPPVITRLALKSPLAIVNSMLKFVKWWILTFRIDAKKEPEQARKYSAVIESADPWKFRQSAKECLPYKAWDNFSDIDTDVILIGASADKMHKSSETKRIEELLPKSSYVDFPSNKATHSVTMAEYVHQLSNGSA